MVVFRLADENDAKEYLDFFKAVTSESNNLASNIAEVEKLSVDDERSFIKGMNLPRFLWRPLRMIKLSDHAI